jgi:hypothetical protein
MTHNRDRFEIELWGIDFVDRESRLGMPHAPFRDWKNPWKIEMDGTFDFIDVVASQEHASPVGLDSDDKSVQVMRPRICQKGKWFRSGR